MLPTPLMAAMDFPETYLRAVFRLHRHRHGSNSFAPKAWPSVRATRSGSEKCACVFSGCRDGTGKGSVTATKTSLRRPMAIGHRAQFAEAIVSRAGPPRSWPRRSSSSPSSPRRRVWLPRRRRAIASISTRGVICQRCPICPAACRRFSAAIAHDGVPVAVISHDRRWRSGTEGFIVFEEGGSPWRPTQGMPATVKSTVSTSPALPEGNRFGRTVDGIHSTVGKGLGVEAGRRLGVLVVPDTDGVLRNCHFRSPSDFQWNDERGAREPTSSRNFLAEELMFAHFVRKNGPKAGFEDRRNPMRHSLFSPPP